jgi:hypothetical protein
MRSTGETVLSAPIGSHKTECPYPQYGYGHVDFQLYRRNTGGIQANNV